jgi:O-antigen/teichoic acid export membrane protein
MFSLAQENKPLGAKVIRNVAFGALRALLVAPVPFLLTPLILSKVGARGYGTWAVFVTINSLTSLADLGLLGTLSKYVAEYYTRRDFLLLNRLLSTGLVVYGLTASAVAALLWLASSRVVALLFRGSPFNVAQLSYLFHCALLLVWANILTFLFSSVTSGLQRMDLTHMMSTLNLLCSAIGGAAFLLAGWGVPGLLYASVGSAVLTLLIYNWLMRRLLPQVVLNPFRASGREAKKIFSFSLRIYVTQAAFAIHNQIEKLFLALFVGVVPVGWYDIASDIAFKVRSAPGLLLSPVLPAASELDARGEDAKLRELYYRAHKYLAFFAVPLIFFLVAISSRFVELWIGPGFRVVALPLSALLLVNFFNLTTGPGYMILVGQGILGPGVYSALIGIGVCIPLSCVLIYLYGFSGAVVGTSVSIVTSSVYFLYRFHHHTKYSVRNLLLEAYMKPVLCAVILLFFQFLVIPAATLSGPGLLAQGFIFTFLYTTVLLLTKFFDSYDWRKIENVAPIARLVRKIAPV